MNDHTTRPARIALAEDNSTVRVTFTRLLAALGHEVICASENGAELLTALGERQVDLAFVDLDMPVMDGLEVAEHLTARGVPVVLVSGHPDANQIVMEHEPFVARIRKPATVESLQAAIEAALTRRPRQSDIA